MLRNLIIVLCLWVSVTQVYATDARTQLLAFLSEAKTFEAEFNQTLIGAGELRAEKLSGKIYVHRPDRFRWEYDGDEGQLIVADGKRIWLVEPDLEQVSHRAQKAALRGTPAWLLTGGGVLEDDFEPRELGEYEGRQWLELIPRDPESQFERILLGLDNNQLLQLKMADKFGQITEYKFSNLQTDLVLNDELFIYEPPSSFDVIDD